MDKYAPGDHVGDLEHWPFDAPESDYRIVVGAPKAFGRIDKGGRGHITRYGIWRCTTGAFECTEQGDELMIVLSGRCRITWLDSGKTRDLGAGDTMFMHDKTRVRWDILEDVTKVFFGVKAEGY